LNFSPFHEGAQELDEARPSREPESKTPGRKHQALSRESLNLPGKNRTQAENVWAKWGIKYVHHHVAKSLTSSSAS
jgi:hypothetical protein